MVEWIRYGPLLLMLWTREVGFWAALRGCAWVIVRKALPRQKAMASALMPRSRTLELQVPGHAHPFYARWPASDLHIAYMVLRRKEYAPMAACLNGEAELVFLDLGANIGATSRYFLETFPGARVIAVEPDSGNLEMCHKNLDAYGDRIRIVQAAVWSRKTSLIFEEDSTETGTEAGIRVREPHPGEDLTSSIAAIDIPSLLSDGLVSPSTQVALKIDIEGSEEEVFGVPNLDWLDRVSCIAIELHDKTRKNCSRNFFSAVEGRLLEPPKRFSETVFAHLKVRQAVGMRAAN